MSEGQHFRFRVAAQPQAIFETPIVQARLEGSEALCAALAEAVTTRKSHHAGEPKSTVGGWHSDYAMMEWGGAAARALSQVALQIAERLSTFVEPEPREREWSVVMWANVLSPGGFNHLHLHPGNLWSAVFYVDAGEADGDVGGELFLEDPRHPISSMRDAAFRFAAGDGRPQDTLRLHRPRTGELLVFPAWLRHGVRPYRGARDRVSIAMNIDAQVREPQS